MTAPVRILLVEDDEEDQLITRRLLEQAYGSEMRLDWTSDWPSALEAIERDEHDVYLVDYELGGHTGLELVADAKARASTAAIILLTGHSSREVEAQALAAGTSDYLEKADLSATTLARSIRYSLERAKAERRLISLARIDPLTGLDNRNVFNGRLESELLHAERHGVRVGLLLIDLDHFKDVNDTLGHPVGDALLIEASKRLKQLVRGSDTVARLGGDEFAIISSDLVDTVDAGSIAQKIVATIATPFQIEGHEIHISASVGLALYPDDSRQPDDLLRHADLALYAVKDEGRNGYRFFDAEMNSQALARKALESAMRTGLARGEFRPYFQPKLDLVDERVVGVEALARWCHPSEGLVMPEQFIPVAEATGLIVPLGETILRQACEQHVAWRRAGLPPIPVAVNVSAVQIKRSSLVQTLKDVLQETGMDASLLDLELTENIVMDGLPETRRTLEEIRDLGVRLAIDDFGTGYSSLAYLKHFPVGVLKIDRSFVREIDTDADDAAISRAIIQLATSLNLDVIAEGVENTAQATFLREHGCRQVQGFLFSQALDATDFESYWRDHVLQPAARAIRRSQS